MQILSADGLKCQFEGAGVSQLNDECRMSFKVSVISILRVMRLPSSCVWLISQGAKLFRTVKNSGIFREFYARFFMNTVPRSACVFSRYCAHALR